MVCQNSLYNSHQVEGWSIRKEIVIYVQRISCKKAIELVVLGCPIFRKIAKKEDDNTDIAKFQEVLLSLIFFHVEVNNYFSANWTP